MNSLLLTGSFIDHGQSIEFSLYFQIRLQLVTSLGVSRLRFRTHL